MIKLIVFLGNPGREYRHTRHNIGWMIAEELDAYIDWQKKFKGLYAQYGSGKNKFYLLKPQNFMNLSGESVQLIMAFFKIKSDEILVVHDDLELDFGQISLKKGGGLGGHNGLRSISKNLNTNDFYRMRMGISRPARGSVSSYVLSKFSADEAISLPDYLKKGAAILETCMKIEFQNAVEKFSKINLINI